jgi:hypothetical protein
MTRNAITLLAAVLGATSAQPALAEPDSNQAGARSLGGLGLGVEVGEPSSLTVGYMMSELGLGGSVSVGSGILAGSGLSLRADVTWIPLVLRRTSSVRIPLRVGIGGRYYNHSYEPMSVDEINDEHAGLRVAIGTGLALMNAGVEVYGEIAPGYDLWRSDSCNLASGALSVCPHALSSRGFVQGVVGVRYFFGL